MVITTTTDNNLLSLFINKGLTRELKQSLEEEGEKELIESLQGLIQNNANLQFFINAFEEYKGEIEDYKIQTIKSKILTVKNLISKNKYQEKLGQDIEFLLKGIRLINAFREWLTGATLNYRITNKESTEEVVVPWIKLFSDMEYITLRADDSLHILEGRILKKLKENYGNSLVTNYKIFEEYATKGNWLPAQKVVSSYSKNKHTRYLKDSKDNNVSMYYSQDDSNSSTRRYFILDHGDCTAFKEVTTFSLGNLKEWYEEALPLLIEYLGQLEAQNLLQSLDHPIEFIAKGKRQDSESGLRTGDYAKAEKILEQSKKDNDKLFSIMEVETQINDICSFLETKEIDYNKNKDFVQSFLGKSNKLVSEDTVNKAIEKLNQN